MSWCKQVIQAARAKSVKARCHADMASLTGWPLNVLMESLCSNMFGENKVFTAATAAVAF